jgi:hypothetical protein
VKAASDGRINESFDRLDRMGCIRETAAAERPALLAAEYLASVDRGEKTLVVAQTWDEVNRANEAIREALRSRGKIGEGVALKILQTVDLSEAQKRDARFIPAGAHAVFRKGYGRFKRGDACSIVEANDRGLVLLKNGRRSTLSYRRADRVSIATESEMQVATGDRLQLKFNGRTQDGQRIANGELVTVRQVNGDGSLGENPRSKSTDFSARLCRNLVRLAGQNRRYRARGRFRLPDGNQRQPVVCRHLPGPEAGDGVHRKQSRAEGEHRAFRRPRPRYGSER